MALPTVDYGRLATMTQDEARDYLRELYSGGIDPNNSGLNLSGNTEYIEREGGGYSTPSTEYAAGITKLFDPEYAGGVYGGYEGVFDPEGNLKDVRFKKGERHEGWYAENSDWIDPLIVAGAMGLGGGLFGGMGGGAGAGAGISEGVMAGLETGGFGAGASGISPGVAAGLEAGLPALEGAGGAGISEGTMAGLETGGFGSGAGGISEGTMAGLEGGVGSATGDIALVDGAAGAVAQPLTATEAIKQFGVTKALQLGLLGAGVVDALTKGSSSGGGSSNLQNPVHPYKFERTVNPAATPLTSKDAYAYLSGKPSPTTGQPISTGAQNWFTDKFTALDGRDASTGETLIRDPNSGRYIPQSAIDAAQKQADDKNKADTATGANGGLMALADGGYVFDTALADGGLMALAGGGSTLGSYSDGGRLLRGPGDGVSDSIPATIGGKQPARLADGEFVVPARIVSELGNGSTEAGARKLYAMMDRIQAGRRKTVGKKAVAKDSKADKHLPA